MNVTSKLMPFLLGILVGASVCKTYLYADSWHCDVLPIDQILKSNSSVNYIACSQATPFEYHRLPLTDDHYLHPYYGTFNETFILTIDQGNVYGRDGWVLLNDTLIHELIWQEVYLTKSQLQEAKKNPFIKKAGRVAVIAQTGYSYYYHWMVEVLGRLALLEMNGISYDYLYAPASSAFMKQTLQLWGVDPSKIIEASDDYIVTADQLIVPSLVGRAAVDGCPRLVHYIPDYIVRYIRAKLLWAVEKQEQVSQFNKKIFISRQDASARKIINEDEVFSLLLTHGFERYHLTRMSLIDQIMLFKNAEVIVSVLGSGLTNLMFCNPEVQVIELYQARRDSTIWNLSQMVGLQNHTCVKTTDFIDHYEGQYDTIIPLNIIEEVLLLQLNKQ
jgi:hypothetical protein